MVVALGAELAPDSIPGLAGSGHAFYTLPGAVALCDALTSVERGKAGFGER